MLVSLVSLTVVAVVLIGLDSPWMSLVPEALLGEG